MRYKGTGFNDKWAITVTWEQFYKEMSQHTFTQYNKAEQEKSLKQAYTDCHTANRLKPTFKKETKEE